MTVDFDKPDFSIFLTKRQFEACVKQNQVQGGVFGATDLIVSHDDLRVQREPLPRALLHTEQHLSSQTHQANPKEDYFNSQQMKLDICLVLLMRWRQLTNLIWLADAVEGNPDGAHHGVPD